MFRLLQVGFECASEEGAWAEGVTVDGAGVAIERFEGLNLMGYHFRFEPLSPPSPGFRSYSGQMTGGPVVPALLVPFSISNWRPSAVIDGTRSEAEPPVRLLVCLASERESS
jgi:hypothetical protein